MSYGTPEQISKNEKSVNYKRYLKSCYKRKRRREILLAIKSGDIDLIEEACQTKKRFHGYSV